MSTELSARVDALVERLTSRVVLPLSVVASLEEAASAIAAEERASVQTKLAAAAADRMVVHGADRNDAVVLSITIPEPFASRFPDPVEHNHGHEPHLTVLFVAPEMTNGEASKILHLTRAVARTVPPFRLFVDAQSGLQTFGDGESGEKALWLSARSDPRGEIERLHRLLRQTLEQEGVEIQAHSPFAPHVTWSYAENNIDDEVVRKMDSRISDKFARGFWFDVKHLTMSMPNGSTKTIALNPIPRRMAAVRTSMRIA